MSKINSGYEIYAIISIILIVITLLLTSLEYFSAILGPKAGHISKILVAIGILVGLAFGIIALVRALTNPCARQTGTIWDPAAKKCIPQSCPDGRPVCKNTDNKAWFGKCVPGNHCSIGEGQYSYDPDSCECTISCPEGLSPYSFDGKSTIVPPASPTNKLLCGSKCDYASGDATTAGGKYNQWGSAGGDGWCAREAYCAQVLDQHGITASAPGLGSCPIKSAYTLCDSPNDDVPPVACITESSGGGNACTNFASTDEGRGVSDAENKKRCATPYCGEGNNKGGIACLRNKDCGGGKESTCNFSTSLFENKHFQHIGLCNKPSIRATDDRCVNPNFIGETASPSGQPEAQVCSELEGISTYTKQCPDALSQADKILIGEDPTLKKVCATNSLCTNEWQALTYSGSESYCQSTVELCSSGEPSCHQSKGECCEPGTRFLNKESKHECCQSQGKIYKNTCRFTTPDPYDAKYLNSGSVGEAINCTAATFDGSTQQKKLTAILKTTLNASGKEDIGVICQYDSKLEKDVIYGQCGKAESAGEIYTIEHPVRPKSSGGAGSTYENTDICLLKGSCVESGGGSQWPGVAPGTWGADMPLCYEKNAGVLNLDVPKWTGQQLQTTQSKTYSNLKGIGCTPNDLITSDLLNISGVYDWDHDFSDPTNYTYDYNILCDHAMMEVPSLSSPEKKYNVPWPQVGDKDTYNPQSAWYKSHPDAADFDVKGVFGVSGSKDCRMASLSCPEPNQGNFGIGVTGQDIDNNECAGDPTGYPDDVLWYPVVPQNPGTGYPACVGWPSKKTGKAYLQPTGDFCTNGLTQDPGGACNPK